MRYLHEGNDLNGKKLAKLLIHDSPGIGLRAAYIDSLTGSSLQSHTQVQASLAALGLHREKDLFKDSSCLNPLFKARNLIAHEMDMTQAAVRGRGKRTRHERTLETYVEMCHDGLNFTQRILNRLASELSSP